MKDRRTRLRRLLTVAAANLLLGGTINAAVVRIEFDPNPKNAVARGLPPTYQVLRGKAHGELDPNDPRNRIIQDLPLAPRNARGRVEYVATFTLYRPVDNSKQSGVLVYEV